MGLEILQMRECVQIVQYNTNLVFNLKKLIDVFSLKIMSSLPICFGLFLERNIIWNSTKKEGVSEGEYSKIMLSTIELLIFNTLLDGLMHA